MDNEHYTIPALARRVAAMRTLGAAEDPQALDDAALHARLAALSGRR
jgi:hypothetical protein